MNKKIWFLIWVFWLVTGLIMELSGPSDEIVHLNSNEIKKINPTNNNFTFAVIGDSRHSFWTFDKLLQAINKDKALFSVNLGDFVYKGSNFRYRFYLKQIKELIAPHLTVIGNHELKNNGRKNYERIFGPGFYSFALKNSYFILLDNNEDRVLRDHIDWLKQELETSRKFKYCFVFTHKPLFDPRKGLNVIGYGMKDEVLINDFNKLIDKYDVTMLFVSHIHAFYQGTWGQTPFIITGGAGAPLRGDSPDSNFHHYIRVMVSENGIKYEVIKVFGNKSKKMEMLAYDLCLFKETFLWKIIIGVSLIGLVGCTLSTRRDRTSSPA